MSDEQQAEFVELWRQMPSDEMAERFGMTISQVNVLRKSLRERARVLGDRRTVDKLAAKPTHLHRAKGIESEWTEDLERQTLEMRQSGMSSNDIAEVLGFTRQYVILKVAAMRDKYGAQSVGRADRAAIARDYTPIDGHDYNALYPDVPWQCRISGRCQVAGIPR